MDRKTRRSTETGEEGLGVSGWRHSDGLHPALRTLRGLTGLLAGAITATMLVACGGGSADSPEASTASATSVSATTTATTSDTVRTQLGPVRGNVYNGGLEFLGIPFAKPPVGLLRWRSPRDPEPWTSVLATQSFRPGCPQKRFEQGGSSYTLEGDEDCLYLNVWTPSTTGLTPLPVLVFIHGGGQQQGSTGEISGGTQIYNGRNMAARGQAVVVTIEYRLGPLGYLVHPGLETEGTNNSSGNYGVMDQIQALKWVKNNAAAFGGDPTRVMVFGESAGAVNVGNLLVSPQAAGLFQRAGIESGVPLLGDYAGAKAKGVDFVNGFTSASTDARKIAAMRALDWQTLVESETQPVDGGIVQMNWQPVLDRYVFPSDPASAFQSGQYNRVPLLIGSNADEMSLSAPAVVTPTMVKELVIATVPAGLRAQALVLYPPGDTNEEAKRSYVQLLTDAQFTSGVRRAAREVAPQQALPVWRYFFSHKHAGLQGALGSYHGMELFYVFNTDENATGQFTTDDAAVQTQMLKYWVNFARSGNPNGASLATWPRFDANVDCYLEIAAVSNGGQCGLRSAKSDFWDQVAAQR